MVTLAVSATVFEILTLIAKKWLVFPPHPCLRPLLRGTPCNFGMKLTPQKLEGWDIVW